ncbi:hypothetical protein C8N24_5734 [Solirubrobacter pauli]|uniref:Uncharacterized protein n=1 Tax=Solirubrobacter pauli TaxID=166793 RepID=A0A660L1G2_9ACTN|nr:hypothetical protein [Solirubrobacter pauli]RKQ87706.1 hypothetical protein C8N24_5734 [Solirubrobacter pauli]
MKAGQALGFGAWLLVIAWLVLYLVGEQAASGWCLIAAGALLFVAGPLFRRFGEGQVRLTGAVMIGAAVFFVGFGLAVVTSA